MKPLRPKTLRYLAASAIAASLAAPAVLAHQSDEGGIAASPSNAAIASFDIVHAKITTEGSVAVFHMGVSDAAGQTVPTPSGRVAGSDAFAYVWPITVDPYEVGFERSAGILALAAATHPDFDDTPLFDENGDGDFANDGAVWHSHWVVLEPDEACGPSALKVIDIPEGTKPRLPKTWPGLPILLDSPGWQPSIAADTVEIAVAFDEIAVIEEAAFDGVTAGLRVHKNLHAPFFCVVDVFDIASGDLSLPGKVNQ
ncbi:MAG: hypothetical protein AAF637_15615 [Pseudomonadota bacterium]